LGDVSVVAVEGVGVGVEAGAGDIAAIFCEVLVDSCKGKWEE